MFQPHCGHLQAKFYRLCALNVHAVWDPVKLKMKFSYCAKIVYVF